MYVDKCWLCIIFFDDSVWIIMIIYVMNLILFIFFYIILVIIMIYVDFSYRLMWYYIKKFGYYLLF